MNIDPDELNALLDGARTKVAAKINDQVLAQRQNDEGVIDRLNKRIAELENGATEAAQRYREQPGRAEHAKMLTDAIALVREAQTHHPNPVTWMEQADDLFKRYEESIA